MGSDFRLLDVRCWLLGPAVISERDAIDVLRVELPSSKQTQIDNSNKAIPIYVQPNIFAPQKLMVSYKVVCLPRMQAITIRSHKPAHILRLHRPTLTRTEHVSAECLGHHADGLLEVDLRAAVTLQPEGHAHALQHLNVVMNLKRLVKVEQVLVPGMCETLNDQNSFCNF